MIPKSSLSDVDYNPLMRSLMRSFPAARQSFAFPLTDADSSSAVISLPLPRPARAVVIVLATACEPEVCD